MNMRALMQADRRGGERLGKVPRKILNLGRKIEALGMLTSEVETAKTVPRQV